MLSNPSFIQPAFLMSDDDDDDDEHQTEFLGACCCEGLTEELRTDTCVTGDDARRQTK